MSFLEGLPKGETHRSRNIECARTLKTRIATKKLSAIVIVTGIGIVPALFVEEISYRKGDIHPIVQIQPRGKIRKSPGVCQSALVVIAYVTNSAPGLRLIGDIVVEPQITTEHVGDLIIHAEPGFVFWRSRHRHAIYDSQVTAATRLQKII